MPKKKYRIVIGNEYYVYTGTKEPKGGQNVFRTTHSRDEMVKMIIGYEKIQEGLKEIMDMSGLLDSIEDINKLLPH